MTDTVVEEISTMLTVTVILAITMFSAVSGRGMLTRRDAEMGGPSSHLMDENINFADQVLGVKTRLNI